MSEHSPAPWHWERVKPSCIYPEGVTDDGALTLVAADGSYVIKGDGGEGAGGEWWDVEVSEANMPLIASAPKLLAVLQTVCDSVEGWNARASGIGINGPPATVLETARKAREAVKEAKGK